jgi:hypothetical protein
VCRGVPAPYAAQSCIPPRDIGVHLARDPSLLAVQDGGSMPGPIWACQPAQAYLQHLVGSAGALVMRRWAAPAFLSANTTT